jgi:hypothetical protein
LSAGAISAAGTITATSLNVGTLSINNISLAGLISAAGNVTGGNLRTAGNITGSVLNANLIVSQGNISGTNILATSNIKIGGDFVVTSTAPRKITVSSATPSGGNVGDIWYQTY